MLETVFSEFTQMLLTHGTLEFKKRWGGGCKLSLFDPMSLKGVCFSNRVVKKKKK